jgi:hypothetical protein
MGWIHVITTINKIKPVAPVEVTHFFVEMGLGYSKKYV